MNFMGENLVLKLKFCKFEVHYVNLQNAKANFVSANQKLNNPTNNNKKWSYALVWSFKSSEGTLYSNETFLIHFPSTV